MMTVPQPIREILVTGTIVPPEAIALIEDRGFRPRVTTNEHLTDAELHNALEGVSGYLIGGYEEATGAHFARAPHLEAVAWVGTDFKGNVDGWEEAYKLGVAFLNTPGANAVAVAEFTTLLMLNLARPLPHTGASPRSSEQGRELRDLTLGIIGAGRIGAHVARTAKLGFSMSVVYSAPKRNEPLEAALGVAHLALPDLLEQADVVSLHRPGPNDGEPPMLGRPELALMKHGSWLVNTAHPRLVDPPALLWAIEHKQIRAALDGVGEGPEWDRLGALGRDRFLGLRQMGFDTQEANLLAGMRAAEGVCDVLSGKDSELVNNRDYREQRRKRAPRPAGRGNT